MPPKCGLEAVVSKGKRPMDSESEEECSGSKKSLKLFGATLEVQMETGQTAIQLGDQRDGDDQSCTDSLINQIGRDLSISCLLHCPRADYGLVASLNRSFRSLIKSGDIYDFRRKNGVVEYWAYFTCQMLQWNAYDPVNRRWMVLPPMNATQCFTCSDKESMGVGTQLLVFGRDISSFVVHKYSVVTNSWSRGTNMNSPRCLFGSASLGHIGIAAGGCDSRGQVLKVAELYNSDTETWEVLPPLNIARKACSGAFMDGKFYVIGGIGEVDSEILTCAEEFNLETRTWRVINDMSPVITGIPSSGSPPLVAVVKNELYAADHAYMVLKKYNKVTATWSIIGWLPEYAGSVNGWGLAFRGCGDQLIVIAGPRARGERAIAVSSCVPNRALPRWELLVRKPIGSYVFNCAVVGC